MPEVPSPRPDLPSPDQPRLVLRDVVLHGQATDVVITGNKFTGIGPDAPARPGDAEIRCSGRMAIVPPFYNAHTHAAMTLLRGYADDLELSDWLTHHIWPAEAHLTRADIYAGSRLAILEMIKSGTVFYNDMYWTQGATAQAATEMGVRAAIGLLYLSDPEGRIADRNRVSNAELLELAPDLPDRIQVTHAPHAVYTVSEPLLREIAERAADDARMVHIHVSETEQEVRDCVARTGLTPVGLLERIGLLGPRSLLAHCVHLTPEDRETIVARDATIAHMPISNMKLCSGSFDLVAAQAAGARIALGTDGAASNNCLSMLDEMKFASLSAKRQSGSPTAGRAPDILQIATAAGAAAFGIDAGEIAVGRLADALLVDLDHPSMLADHNLAANLVYAADSAVIDTVICDGRVLMAGRRVADEEEIIGQARAAARRVRDRGAPRRR